MSYWRILLDCGHELRLGGRLREESTEVGRPLYCGVCRKQQKLVEYGETEGPLDLWTPGV